MSKEKAKSNNWVIEEADIWAPELQREQWDKRYGDGNWRLVWRLSNKEVLTYEQLFTLYTEAYAKFFEENPVDALFLTNHFSYVYSHDRISQEEAFDPHASYDQPGKADQFHHVAINISLVNILGLEFKGTEPIGRDDARFWSPDKIPTYRPDIIPVVWCPTLEDFYKYAIKLQIKK